MRTQCVCCTTAENQRFSAYKVANKAPKGALFAPTYAGEIFAPIRVGALGPPLGGPKATFISRKPLGFLRTNSRTARTYLFCVRTQHAVRAWKNTPYGVFSHEIREKNTPYRGIFREKNTPYWGIFRHFSSKKIPPMSGIWSSDFQDLRSKIRDFRPLNSNPENH